MGLVSVEHTGGVTTLTLADAERRNALSVELVGELLDAIDAADADPATRVVVLTNEGSVFCAGAPLDAVGGGAGAGRAGVGGARELFERFRRSPKAFVGRIDGHCVAGGMGLAAAMDISVAVESARFGFTEVRVGLAPAMISVLCLPKLRRSDAAAAFLRGNRFPAAEAARLGLINESVAADELDPTVGAVVGDLLAGGPGAIAAVKQILVTVPHLEVGAAFDWTEALIAELIGSPEAREGIEAFLGKRRPAWAPVPEGERGAEGTG